MTLRDLVVTLQLPPGQPVQEEPLTTELGIGRTPFREAVKRLEAEALVAIYPRRGTFVTEVNITDHALIADVRRRLEGHAARRAAERATAEERTDLDALRAEAEGLSDDPPTVMDLDTRVHRAIYRGTHNRYLETTLNHYYNLALRIWYLFADQLPDLSEHVAEHAALIGAVVDGEADRADEVAVRHVDHFEQAIRRVI
nr:GntR family transcriptional regulator [Saccharopolyspora sp. HNM0983]